MLENNSEDKQWISSEKEKEIFKKLDVIEEEIKAHRLSSSKTSDIPPDQRIGIAVFGHPQT